MRAFWARLAAVGMAGSFALLFVTIGAVSTASASSRVHGNNTMVGSLRVSVYSQMCDHGGPLHTRLVVQNHGTSPKTVTVIDGYAQAGYDPPGPIAPGKSMQVHLISSKLTPEHTFTVAGDGASKTMTVPESPCSTTTSSSSTSSTSSTSSSSTTSTTKTSTSSTINTLPTDPGDPGGPTVVGPGVVAVGASIANNGGGGSVVRAASTGTLPFTGTDIRLFAVLGNLLVLIGFGLLYLSHRSPKAAAFLKRLRPSATS